MTRPALISIMLLCSACASLNGARKIKAQEHGRISLGRAYVRGWQTDSGGMTVKLLIDAGTFAAGFETGWSLNEYCRGKR